MRCNAEFLTGSAAYSVDLLRQLGRVLTPFTVRSLCHVENKISCVCIWSFMNPTYQLLSYIA